MLIYVFNGPNLNLLGTRRPEVYGSVTLADIESALCKEFPQHRFVFRQTNSEGELIDLIQQTRLTQEPCGIVLNAGAYSHYSYAIADAIEGVDVPIVEVHISNIFAREEFRHTSVISPVCRGTISGLGTDVYALGVITLDRILKK